MPDYENAGCILLWGYNPNTSWLAAAGAIAKGRARGAKLVVADPRHVGLAVKADQWLQVRPGTAGALGLAMPRLVVGRGRFAAGFLRALPHGPFLFPHA